MRYFFLVTLLSLASASFAQKDKFREGVLTFSNGDSIRGLAAWKKNCGPSDKLYFKSNASTPEQEYSWSEIRSFRSREGKDILKVVNMQRNLEYIDEVDFTIRLKDSTTTGPFPLVPIYIGRKLSLYTLYDKAPFYFVYDGKQVKQLVQKYRYLTPTERMFDYERGRRFHITDEYKGVLAAFYDFSEDQKMRYILTNTIYDDQAFKSLISKMDSKMW